MSKTKEGGLMPKSDELEAEIRNLFEPIELAFWEAMETIDKLRKELKQTGEFLVDRTNDCERLQAELNKANLTFLENPVAVKVDKMAIFEDVVKVFHKYLDVGKIHSLEEFVKIKTIVEKELEEK
jgi:hypothetical protein